MGYLACINAPLAWYADPAGTGLKGKAWKERACAVSPRLATLRARRERVLIR